jgi:hypothetical protein
VQARAGADYDTEPWELYHLAADPSECHDLAAAEPERLPSLVALWWEEAERHGVLPLDDRLSSCSAPGSGSARPHPPDRRYVYRPPMSPLPAQAGPAIGGRSFDLTAHVRLGEGDEGVLLATGTENSGMSLFVQDDRLVLDYNAFGDHVVIESHRPGAGRRGPCWACGCGDSTAAGSAALTVDGVGGRDGPTCRCSCG